MTLFQCLFLRPAVQRSAAHTLADVQPGQTVRLKEFSAAISPQRWAHLQAYGLTPGRYVHVVQHSPVTVVRVEHTELAMEDDLARQIEVTTIG